MEHFTQLPHAADANLVEVEVIVHQRGKGLFGRVVVVAVDHGDKRPLLLGKLLRLPDRVVPLPDVHSVVVLQLPGFQTGEPPGVSLAGLGGPRLLLGGVDAGEPLGMVHRHVETGRLAVEDHEGALAQVPAEELIKKANDIHVLCITYEKSYYKRVLGVARG